MPTRARFGYVASDTIMNIAQPTPPSVTSRRAFLGTTATTAAGLLLSNFARLSAAQRDGLGETEHFHYKLAPADGP